MRRREFVGLVAGLIGSAALPDAFGQTSREGLRAARCAKKKKSPKTGTRAQAKRNTRKMMKASKKRPQREGAVC